MFFAQTKLEIIAGQFRAFDRILRNATVLVFHLHVDILVRQHFFPEPENFGERIGIKAMLDVVGHVRLEQTGMSCFVKGAAAIDEAPGHMPHFRDVIVRRDQSTAGKDESGPGLRRLLEQ